MTRYVNDTLNTLKVTNTSLASLDASDTLKNFPIPEKLPKPDTRRGSVFVFITRSRDFNRYITLLDEYKYLPFSYKLLLVLFEPEGSYIRKDKLFKFNKIAKEHNIHMFFVTPYNLDTSFKTFLTKHFL